jgi:SsrA-binding protein
MNSSKPDTTSSTGGKLLAVNRKARFNYEILESFEAGLVLKGHEIKAIRQGNINLGESYIRPLPDGLYLVGAHITPYAQSAGMLKDYDPTRARKLLLHRREIDRLRGNVAKKGLTIVALDLHLKRGFAKLQIGLARGKDNPDKRQSIKERDQKRDLNRLVKYQD